MNLKPYLYFRKGGKEWNFDTSSKRVEVAKRRLEGLKLLCY
jgi:hypothetical protein